jgi:hypothetical protein
LHLTNEKAMQLVVPPSSGDVPLCEKYWQDFGWVYYTSSWLAATAGHKLVAVLRGVPTALLAVDDR